MKYPKISPASELRKPVGKEFFKPHITSNGVPGNTVDTPTIKAKIAAINTTILTNNTPIGLFSIKFLLLIEIIKNDS